MRYMIGVDVGGTFTDITLVDVVAQRVGIHKLLSTPADPSQAIMRGIREIAARDHTPHDQIDYLAHGTTVATNALIERKGAVTGLLVTKGFRDLLQIGRQMRPSLYDLQKNKPEPFVPPERCKEIPERLYADGQVRKPVDVEALRCAVQELRRAGVESIAICFLFSFVNPEHERIAHQAVQELFPEAYVTVSHQIVPEFREFSRLSTTVLNAFLGPVMQRYLGNFLTAVHESGIDVDPYITQSNGGILTIQESIHAPIRTAVSGPSAGVIAASYLGQLVGLENLITLDLGGTSADISLIHGGQPLLSMERSVEGWPARIPMLDIVTIGAGGGSIAWIDAGGALKVGPQSAGANPGPACYSFGGTEPTVTDANVVLGRMNPQRILGGAMPINIELARQAIAQRLEQQLHLSMIEAASGVIDVVNANMVRATRLVSVERGYDPREFTLVAFGGAGPLHAVAVAQELGIPRVLVPPSPGTLCSFGLLVTDVRTDHVRSMPVEPGQDTLSAIRAVFDELASEGRATLERQAVPLPNRSFACTIDARYRRQNYEIPIPVTLEELTADHLPDLVKRFHDEHARLYGYARPQAPVEFVNYRLTAVGHVPKANLPKVEQRAAGTHPLPVTQREVYFKESSKFVPCPVYQRADLLAGDSLVGPAIVEQLDATTLIPPGLVFHVDAYGNIQIEVTGAQQ